MQEQAYLGLTSAWWPDVRINFMSIVESTHLYAPSYITSNIDRDLIDWCLVHYELTEIQVQMDFREITSNLYIKCCPCN